MNILILNGSPKGKNSTTLQTALYLQALHPEHRFQVFHGARQLRQLEADVSPLRRALEEAELVLFCYPVYTFLAPYQLHRILELIREHHMDLRGKFASQITTSKHFYDMTAQRFLEESCFDLGMRVIRGLSADMDDLLTARGQEEARMYFRQLLFSCELGACETPPARAPQHERPIYETVLPQIPKSAEKQVVVVTNCRPEDRNLQNMIADFQAAMPWETRVVNLLEVPFAGGCLGCMGCAVTEKCVYHDGFDDFLRTKIQSADAIVYAFTIEHHFTGSIFKCFDDRQFCNGHRTVMHGMPVGYIISGDYRYEANLQTVVQARCEVGGLYLCGVATDEENPAGALSNLAMNLSLAMREHLRRPANCYGVGGMKIFRDLIYVMQGFMKADHKFYRKNGLYDFPQKQKKTLWKMKAVGALLALPAAKKNMKGKMLHYIIAPYEKVVEQAKRQAPAAESRIR